MPSLAEIVEFCDKRVRLKDIADFDGAENGLQVENDGYVSKVASAVDGGIESFEGAIASGADFLLVHHGMFWRPPIPVVGAARRKLKLAFDNNLALYGAHLPLDCHPEIGNNAILARRLGLDVTGWFLEYKGNDIAARVDKPGIGREALKSRLTDLFPNTFIAIDGGPSAPQSIGILTGSGQSSVPMLKKNGIDTLITGELKQEHYNFAMECGLNLYLCGHYATEVFGVQALGMEIADAFGIEHIFIDTACPL